MRRSAALSLAVATAAFMAAGCAGPSKNADQPSPSPSSSRADPTTVCSGLTPTPIPAGFRVATVWRCVPDIRQLPDRGLWSVTVVARADTAATSLLRALRTPSAPPSKDHCTAEAVTLVPLVLDDARGHRMTPPVPTDGCGRPLKAVTDAIAPLAFRTVAVVPRLPVRQGQG